MDGRGWPTQDFSLLFYNEPGGFYFPAASYGGIYTITALGCANVSVPVGFAGLSVVNQSCPGGNLLAYLNITSDGDTLAGHAALAFTQTTLPGLKNLSLLMPGWPAGTDPDTLNPDFLNNMRGRCSVTRVRKGAAVSCAPPLIRSSSGSAPSGRILLAALRLLTGAFSHRFLPPRPAQR